MSWDPNRKHTRSHRERSAWVLAKAGGLCQINGPECIRIATEDDHIVPLSEGGSDTNLANHQAACGPCHRLKTAAEAARGRALINAKATRPARKHPGLRQ